MKKVLILISITLWMFLPVPVLARAGGGGSGGSSGGSGGSSSPSHDHTSTRYDPIGSTISIISMTTLILLLPSLPIYAFRIKIRKNTTVCIQRLKDISSDAAWDKSALYARVEDIYFHVQEAWTNQDIEAMRPHVSDHIYEQWKMKLSWMQLRNETNICKRVRLRHHAVVSIQKPDLDEEECCWFYIEGSMVDYTIDTDTGKLIDGKRRSMPFVEFWKLIHRDDQFYLDEIRQKDEVDLEAFLNKTTQI